MPAGAEIASYTRLIVVLGQRLVVVSDSPGELLAWRDLNMDERFNREGRPNGPQKHAGQRTVTGNPDTFQRLNGGCTKRELNFLAFRAFRSKSTPFRRFKVTLRYAQTRPPPITKRNHSMPTSIRRFLFSEERLLRVARSRQGSTHRHRPRDFSQMHRALKGMD
jgi:hypothetical protein